MANPSGPSIFLTKHHGLGNDFLVAVEPARALTAADAVAWCDRRTGVGADGLIMATQLGVGSQPALWRMVLWNSDGGRAEISGNGLRCLAQALADHPDPRGSGPGAAAGSDDLALTIETDAGAREATVLARSFDDGGGASDRVRVGMGKALDGPAPSDRWAELGVTVDTQVGVDLGNPHLVAFVDSLDGIDMAAIGPVVEADYPSGCNIHVVRVVGPDRIEMVIWERGAGVTMACGSGACAAAWAGNRAGLLGARVAVDMPGGTAEVVLGDEVVLVGPAVRVAEIRIDG